MDTKVEKKQPALPKKGRLNIKNLTPNQKKALLGGATLSTILAGWGIIELTGGLTSIFNPETPPEINNDDDGAMALPTDTPFAKNVDDGMNFKKAFDTARAETGSGGLFNWRGRSYNTWYKEEWEALSTEDKQAYLAMIEGKISTDPSEIQEANPMMEAEMYDTGTVESGGLDTGEIGDTYNEHWETTDPAATDEAGVPITAADLVTDAAPPSATVAEQPAEPPAEYTTTNPPPTAPTHFQQQMAASGGKYDEYRIDANDDNFIEAIAIDLDHDGFIDMLIQDTDGDHLLDTYLLDMDAASTQDLDTMASDPNQDLDFEDMTHRPLDSPQTVTMEELRPVFADAGAAMPENLTLPDMDNDADVSDLVGADAD